MKYLESIKSFSYIKESDYWKEVEKLDFIRIFGVGDETFTNQELLRITQLLKEYQGKTGFVVFIDISEKKSALNQFKVILPLWLTIDEFVREITNQKIKTSGYLDIKIINPHHISQKRIVDHFVGGLKDTPGGKPITKFTIRKKEDEWFWVNHLESVTGSGYNIDDFKYRYYQCDQIDGLINLLEFILRKSLE
jgi:hypothetical protein